LGGAGNRIPRRTQATGENMDLLKQGLATLLISLFLGPCVANSDLFEDPPENVGEMAFMADLPTNQ
jgi:hypothetical protein